MPEFVKSCLDDEAVVVKEIGGWKASWEERVRSVVHGSHTEMGDGVVRSPCYCNFAYGSSNGYVVDSFHRVG